MPEHFVDVGECVEHTLRKLGKRIVMALPLGLGKPIPLVNEFYRRAARDPSLQLEILTALSLHVPRPSADLERRFLEPFAKRIFGNYPELDYIAAARADDVPPNIRVMEFYLEPGGWLDAPYVQQHYVSVNYTHVAQDVLARGVNLLLQLVAKRTVDGRPQYSLSCNPDVTVDLLPHLEARRQAGQPIAVIGQTNSHLPFMFGDAPVGEEVFDAVVDDPRYDHDLYAPPNMAIGTTDFCIGLNAGALVRDAGTLQLGIGELGDSVVYCLQLRHQQNETWRRVMGDTKVLPLFENEIESIGGTGIFAEGLYGCTEMFVDGFLDLYRSGILKRRVYPHVLVQRLLNARRFSETVNATMLDELLGAGLAPLLNRSDFDALQAIGILDAGCEHSGHRIRTPAGEWIPADLSDAKNRARVAAECLGTHLREGVLLHGGFFLGPRGFYGALREMREGERRQFHMTGVSFINRVDAPDYELRVAQRQHARFINTAMMATLTGAAVSDGLADGRVVSGVGGQYNFVAMAHALPDARSILCVRSTRTKNRHTTSNVVWNYGHTTIPRHLRDVLVTEYGIADLRGKTDSEVIAATLAIADSRFQEDLLREARAAGKIARDYRVPDRHRGNTPEALEKALAPHRRAGLFSEYPFGTDFTAEEAVLARALKQLRERTSTVAGRATAVAEVTASSIVRRKTPIELRRYLERMQLDQPRSFGESLMRGLLMRELRKIVAGPQEEA